MGQRASPPPRQCPQPLRSHPPALQWPYQGCGSAPQPAYRYAAGRVVENSKEGFRKLLQEYFPEPDVLLNKDRMGERHALARDNELPVAVMVST